MREIALVAMVLGAGVSAAFAQTAPAPSGQAVYERRCAACHERPADGRTPGRDSLQRLTSARILRTLDFGPMMTIAYELRRDEREAVAAFLGRPDPEPPPAPSAFCADRRVSLDVAPPVWNGWSASPDNRRFVPEALAGLTAADVPKLKLKWAFGFDGDTSTFAQPTVIGSQVFVGSAAGTVHALRADTGCLQWVFQANGPIRSAIVAVPDAGRHLLLFGDLTGWFYALDASNGQLVWRMRPDDHEAVRLSAPPLVYGGIAFVPVASWEESRSLNPDYPCCTFRGSVVALRVRDGSVLWKTYTVSEPAKPTGKTPVGTPTLGPSGVGIWGSPSLDLKRHRLYVATGNNYSAPMTPTSDAVLGLDLDTGRIVWSRQVSASDVYNSACSTTPVGVSCPPGSGPDSDFGSPPVVVTTPAGRDLVVAGQKSGVVWAFDPDRSGEVVWQARVGQGGINGGVQWGMASDGERIFAAVSDAVATRTATARILNPSIGGGLTALNIADGSTLWRASPTPCTSRPNCSPGQSAALTAIAGAVFSGSLDGHMRALSTKDGALVWDVDTIRSYDTVNGVAARGGAIDGPGAVVVGGRVFIMSGYSRFGGTPGNVLLVFGVD